jgi:hypothetical protein
MLEIIVMIVLIILGIGIALGDCLIMNYLSITEHRLRRVKAEAEAGEDQLKADRLKKVEERISELCNAAEDAIIQGKIKDTEMDRMVFITNHLDILMPGIRNKYEISSLIVANLYKFRPQFLQLLEIEKERRAKAEMLNRMNPVPPVPMRASESPHPVNVPTASVTPIIGKKHR